jgi:endonuclease-3
MNKPEIKVIIELLIKEYGHRELKPHHDPLAELVRTILSQNTSDVNSRPAFRSLISTFDTWEKVIQADTALIAGAIKRGGLARIKALRIQQALKDIEQKRGVIDLGFLEYISFPEAREWLMRLPGVGYKTANCVLLFALGKPALPVDTHIYRVSKRLGLVRENASLDEAHNILEPMVPRDHIYEFHVLMIEHGRRICIARNPQCTQCVLNSICTSSNIPKSG